MNIFIPALSQNTFANLKLWKKIVQVANVLIQRLRIIGNNNEKYKLSKKYFEFLKKRTKEKSIEEKNDF